MSLQEQIYCLIVVIVLLISLNLHFVFLIRRMLKSDLLFRRTVTSLFKQLFDTISYKTGWSEINSPRDKMVKTVCKKCGEVFETARILAETESMLCATCFQEAYLGKFSEQ